MVTSLKPQMLPSRAGEPFADFSFSGFKDTTGFAFGASGGLMDGPAYHACRTSHILGISGAVDVLQLS